MKILRNRPFKKQFFIILLVIFILFLTYYVLAKKNSLNIDAERISKIEIFTQPILIGDYHFVIEEKKEIKDIIKKINKIKVYPTNELPGESSPHAHIILYDQNSKKETIYFYGGMAGYKKELYTTGFLINWQLKQICCKTIEE